MWSSLVMTPASHAGNPEFESRHAYLIFFLVFVCGNESFFGSMRRASRHFARVVKGLAC